jgi:hypothetical protein
MTPIRKGANPVKIPFQIKTTDRTLAAWCNEVRTALQQLEARQPTANVGRGGSAGSALQFKISIRKDGETWKAKVRPGWVRNRNADADATEPVKDWMPTMGDPAVALDAETAPEIEIADGQTVYCRVATTDKGIIEEAPTIESADTPEAGTHFQPPNASAEGDLYFPLANITITGDPAVVTIEQIQQGGPLNVTPNLPELLSVGGEREVFKERVPAGDRYEFRTLRQLDGGAAGLPIIKPEPSDPSEADALETIDFKYITERGTSPQVQIEDVAGGNGIRVKGNDYYTEEAGVRKFTISVKDGLISSLLKDDDSGGNLNLTVVTFEWAASGPDGSMMRLSEYTDQVHYWRDGVYIGTTNPADAPAGLIEQTITHMVESS